MQSTSATGIRIGFTDAAHTTQKRVVWDRSPAADLVAGTPAHGYFMALCEARERCGTAGLVAQLGQWRTPLPVSDDPRLLHAVQTASRAPRVTRDGHGAQESRPQWQGVNETAPGGIAKAGAASVALPTGPHPMTVGQSQPQAGALPRPVTAPGASPQPTPGADQAAARTSDVARQCAALLSRRDATADIAAARLALAAVQIASGEDLAAFIAQLREALAVHCRTLELARDAEVRFVQVLATGSTAAVVDAYLRAMIARTTLALEDVVANLPLLEPRLPLDVRVRWAQHLRMLEEGMAGG
jgi:hypothetical protein